MAFNGLEFYERLSDVCSKNGTTITAFLISAGKSQSAGTYMKKRKSPDAKLVAQAAERFGVSAEWLMGIDEPNQTPELVLNQKERSLIERLRLADGNLSEVIYTMCLSVLPEIQDKSAFFSSTNDIIQYHPTGKFSKKVEGEAAAGTPITAVPSNDETIPVPEKYLEERYFIVRARGNSMLPMIPNGAYCVFNRDASPDDGRVVLVQIESQTDQPDDTIKRIFRRGKQVELRAENPDYESLFYSASDIRVSGVLVDVLE